ncbi:hypothetical protein GCM10023220_62890 [Streptomyces ziwulingensis]|uniref:Uncharacterized protein n=1 Tax=Streptomyces ziwulingensis TaxID=1045501 RepID=A0ABP9CWN7_9ACTN
MTAPQEEELTPWERAFLADPDGVRGYQPQGGADTPEEPPEPPQGPAGASAPDSAAQQRPRTGND